MQRPSPLQLPQTYGQPYATASSLTAPAARPVQYERPSARAGDASRSSARDDRLLRASPRRDGFIERLSQRTDSACLVDRWARRDREGDIGLSNGALRARAS